MKPICAKCHRFFRPSKNGLFFLEGFPVGNDIPPGLAQAEDWRPYKLWCGDEWKCQGCGTTIIVGCGRDTVAEHFQPDFADKVEAFGATFQVNDC